MTSVQRLIANDRSVVAAAAITASSVATSRAVRRASVVRAGHGGVRLVGDYSGGEDATFDIEIASGGTAKRASAPLFTGVGNGTLTPTSVSAATLGEYVFALSDLGVTTDAAWLQIEHIILRAVATGTAGNAIRITVTPALTLAATAYAVMADWPAGEETMAGAEYDFGGLPLSASGELDGATARIQFGGDPTVYRPYRAYVDGAWRYGLTPAPKAAILAGASVSSVTGGYTVTVTDGTTTEVYAGKVTFHDMLTALAASALVMVEGVVTADRKPGGMAIRDIPLRTAAWLLSSSGTAISSLTIAEDADSEVVTVECVNADRLNAETWRVSGSRSGALGTATTGTAFTSTVVGFTVPAVAATGNVNDWSGVFAPTSRTTEELLPAVCIRNFTPGINARPGSVTYRYEKRPENACSCETAGLYGRIDPTCLGLEESTMPLATELATRLDDLYAWRAAFYAGSVGIGPDGKISGDPEELPTVEAFFSLFLGVLRQVYDDVDALAEYDALYAEMIASMSVFSNTERDIYPSRQVLTLEAITADYIRFETTGPTSTVTYLGKVIKNPANGLLYYVVAQSANFSTYMTPTFYGYSQWPTDPAAEFKVINDVVGATQILTLQVWPNPTSLTYAAQHIYQNPYTRQLFRLKSITVSGADTASLAIALPWAAGWPTTTGDTIYTSGVNTLVFSALSSGDSVSDMTATAEQIASMTSTMVTAYAARLDYALYLAGKFDASSGTSGDGCWRDSQTEAYWWVDTTGKYLPAFSNQAWISSWASTGESTQEFGLFIAVGCTDRLKEGDQITLTIGSVDGSRPYAVGDAASLALVTSGPAWFAGGIDGDDTHTWRVTGPSGAMADYDVPSDGSTIPPYTAGGLIASLVMGGIDFALGDRFAFSVESGQFKWRKNAGAWSALTNITDADVTLADGLSARFSSGAAPSFVGGDAWGFSAEQTHAPSHIAAPDGESWQWSGASASASAALGSSQTITAVALADYSFPDGAVVTVEGGNGSTWPNSVVLDVTGPVAVAILASAWNVTHVRVSVASATGGRIGWLWAGQPLATDYHADTCRLARAYAVSRGGGVNPSSLYMGRGTGGELAWNDTLSQSDLDGLLAMLDHLKANDQPMILVPHHLHPDEAALVRIDADRLDISDVFEFQPNADTARRISVSIPLQPVMA